jgi:hypothetical protein
MATVWITFATEDNVDGNIDYLAQEISQCGWKTRMHPMFPGEDDKIDRLMPAFLARPEQSDAWILYGSDKALEHGRAARIRVAMERALGARGEFPAVGLFPGAPDTSLQLTHTVGMHDDDWRTQLGEALGCDLRERKGGVVPGYVATVNVVSGEDYRYVFECRPKMGRWTSFVFAVLPEEKARVAPKILGDADAEEGFSEDAQWYFQVSRRTGTPAESYSVLLRELPSRLAFGPEGMNEAVILELRSTQ